MVRTRNQNRNLILIRPSILHAISCNYSGLYIDRMHSEKPKLEVSEEKFNAILKRLLDHKPVPKKAVASKRKKKLGKIIGETR